MLHVFGYPIQLPAGWEFLDNIYGAFAVTLAAWLIVSLALYLVITYPFALFVRRLPGDIADILLEIVRKPILVIFLALGARDSFNLLPIVPFILQLIDRVALTIIMLVVVQVSWHIIKDVLVYYGARWAKTTESNLDDNLIPALNLFGPLVILINGGLIILPVWGIDISSVLVGAGVVGLVLGLALQEPLSNVFSGLSLLIESPFRQGDLIQFAGDRLGLVERLGLRSTQIYSVYDHSTVYMPNKALSSNMILNLSKPTEEQKHSILVTIDRQDDMARVQEELLAIANAHPNVVNENLGPKIAKLSERIVLIQQRAESLKPDDPVRLLLLDQVAHYQSAIVKLELECNLNEQLAAFQEALVNLLFAVRAYASGGWSSKERKEFKSQYVTPAAQVFQKTVECAEAWIRTPDPWISNREQRQQKKFWDDRTLRLKTRWHALEQMLENPRGRAGLRLDESTVKMLDWLKLEYKILPEDWKNPYVTFKEFEGDHTKLMLWFFVDNVRLEHFERPRRVITEIAREIREYLGTRFVSPDN
jgi:MscS family membrane protein